MVTLSAEGDRLRTLERSMRVLDCFRERAAWTLMDVVRTTGMNTTVVHRILNTFVATGYLEREPGSRLYTLGARIYQFVGAATRLDIAEMARPIMRRLAEETGETVYLTVYRNRQSVCIAKVDSTHEVKLMMQLGGVYSLEGGASNKVLLAFLPGEMQEAYIEANVVEERRDGLRKQLQQIVAQGYCYSAGEVTPGAYAIGVPVRNAERALVAALSLGGPLFRFDEERKKSLVAAVTAAVRELEEWTAGTTAVHGFA